MWILTAKLPNPDLNFAVDFYLPDFCRSLFLRNEGVVFSGGSFRKGVRVLGVSLLRGGGRVGFRVGSAWGGSLWKMKEKGEGGEERGGRVGTGKGTGQSMRMCVYPFFSLSQNHLEEPSIH